VLFPRSSALGSEDIRDLWDAVLRALPRIDVVFLDKMPEHVGGLSNPLVRLGATPIGISGHATALTGSWTSFEATRLPRRRTLRRYRRRLAAIGPVRFEIPESPERREKVLAAMVRQKERRFAETGATGFRSPGKMEFFLEAGRRLAEGPVHLSALVVGDEIVATHLGYVYDRRFYQIMPTYEGGPWQALSVGRLLHEDLIEWSFRNGIGIFDFGIGDEAYKLEYCDEMLPLHRIVMPLTAAGRIYLTALDARDRIRDSALWARVRAFKRGLSPSPSGPGDDEP
ncbi:MAG TPA: GNAT family N-acetyltransferase, partial [Bauldia sp.]|nr:GNAT family N-acetyltransferase [Bauldia sp.]